MTSSSNKMCAYKMPNKRKHAQKPLNRIQWNEQETTMERVDHAIKRQLHTIAQQYSNTVANNVRCVDLSPTVKIILFYICKDTYSLK